MKLKNKIKQFIDSLKNAKAVIALVISFASTGYGAGTWVTSQLYQDKFRDVELQYEKYKVKNDALCNNKILDLKTKIGKLEVDLYKAKMESSRYRDYANLVEITQQLKSNSSSRVVAHYKDIKKRFER